MNWKARRRHRCEMRLKMRGNNPIIPPVPKPVKVLKVCNPARDHNPFLQRALNAFALNAFVGIKPGPIGLNQIVGVVDQWGTRAAVPKTSAFKCPFNFIDRLERRGYEILGRGAYSTVLGKENSDRVIKVSRSLDDWIDYIQWGAKNGYAGNFVPRVYSWKRHKRPDNGHDWSVAVVEKMANTCTDNKHDMSLLLNLYYPADSGNTMAKVYMEDLCPGSYKFFVDLRRNHFSSDIGGKNTMIRKDGTVCFTDPTCGQIKTTQKRFRTGDFSPSVLRIIFESCYRH